MWKCSHNFYFFVFILLLLGRLLLKAQFNLVAANILNNHGVHPVLLESEQSFLVFHISVQLNVPSTIDMQTKGYIESLPCRGLLLSFYELMKLGVLAK